ncbi:hypothetical protein BSKO_00583 [Bryopsis sp. KO-2023]|nr:hypothetical protein BSKO_00583 [Bryopsis sp. KO-2023]
MHSCVDCELLGGAVMGEDDHILRKDRLHIVNAQTKEWLQSRGYPVPQQKLTSIQKRETQECFALLDADGSGTLDVDEVMTAFTMLGLPVKRFDILKLFKAVDPEGNHELQYPAFEKMMTIATADNNGNSQSVDRWYGAAIEELKI